MANYFPDNWVKIKITLHSGEVLNKLLVGWSGGYTTEDSWRLSSDPGEPDIGPHHLTFTTNSGSNYHCHKEAQCLRMNCAFMMDQLRDHRDVKEVEIINVDY